jgi:type VI protein secretion system component Hcp
MPVLMSIDGIKGSAEIPEFEGWLLLSRLEWSGARSIIHNMTGQGRRVAIATAPQLKAVKVSRQSDFVSPQIWELMLGTTRKTVRFAWLRTGADGTLEAYMRIELAGALITGMGEESVYAEPEESITFTFQTVTLTVTNIGDALSGAQDVVSYDVPQAMRR